VAKQNLKDVIEHNVKSEPYRLVGEFERLYREKYNRKPRINRYKYKWAMVDMIEDYGSSRIYEAMQYFFSVDRAEHTIDFFVYNFDRIEKTMTEIQKDREHRQKLREATKKMVEGTE
jgi:hypothetical protein